MSGRFSLEAIFKGVDRTTRVARAISNAMGRTHKSLAAGVAKLNALNNTVIGGLKSVALAATATAVAVGGIALNVGRTGADFEQAITNVGAVSLMTRDQVAELEKKALELGATTKFSATEVANGMELMGKAGFDNAQILEGIGGVLSAAAADGGELAETAGHISNVLKGMGLATSEVTRVADVLTLASARTNSSIGSLGESMANVSSTARQFKIPLEDTVAAVAMLQDVGLDASEAGSAVNTMLTQMAAPSKKAQQQMKELGISFQDAKGNMLPFGKVLEQLKKSADKSGGNMKQVAFFAELVGLRGQKAAGNLKDLFNSGKFQSLVKELDGARGSAEKMSKIRMDTLLGDIETLGGSIDSLKIALHNTQSGPLRKMVQGITKWIDANQELIKMKVVEFIERAIPVIENFAQGVEQGFKNMMPWLEKAAGVFEELFGAGSAGPRQNAFIWGERITEIAGALVILQGALLLAQGAVFLWGIAAKGAAVWTFLLSTAQAVMAFTTAPCIPMLLSAAGAAALAAAPFVLLAAAVLLLADAFSSLSTATGGHAWEFIGDLLTPGQDARKNVNDRMNAEAKARAKERERLGAVEKAALEKRQGGGAGANLPSMGISGLQEQMKGLDKLTEQIKAREEALKKAAPTDIAAAPPAFALPPMAAPGAAPFSPATMGLPPLPGGFDMAALSQQIGEQMQNIDIQGSPQVVLADREPLKDSMEITVRAESGSEAEVTDPPKTKRTKLKLQPSGDP